MYNGHEGILEKLLKDENYLHEQYYIQDVIFLTQKIVKLSGYTISKNKQIGVVITKYEIKDREIKNRIENLLKLVEDNVIIVENIWIESKNQSLYIKNKLFINLIL